MAIERTLSVPQTIAQRQIPDLKKSVANFKKKALPRSYNLGGGERAFEVGLLTMIGIPSPSLVGQVLVFYGLGKAVGLVREKAVINDLARTVRTPEAVEKLRAEMNEQELSTVQQERLAVKLAKRGVEIRDIPMAVRNYEEVYAMPHLWSLGAGRQIFNKVWAVAVSAAGMLPALVGKMVVAACAKNIAIVLAGMFVAGKIYGKIREVIYLNRLAKMIKTAEDKAALQLAMQDLSPESQKRLHLRLL